MFNAAKVKKIIEINNNIHNKNYKTYENNETIYFERAICSFALLFIPSSAYGFRGDEWKEGFKFLGRARHPPSFHLQT